MTDFQILIASVPDREKIVAEIWFDNNLVAEINQEGKEFEIDLYPAQRLSFRQSDFLDAVEVAKKKLIGLQIV